MYDSADHRPAVCDARQQQTPLSLWVDAAMMEPTRRDDPRTAIDITPYQRRYRHDVREMLFRSYYAHIHLDWQETDSWLDAGRSTVLVAWRGRRIVGVMGASEPLDGACWIRLAAVQDGEPPHPVIETLWRVMRLDLRELHAAEAAILQLREWAGEMFAPLGFQAVETIVTLRREAADPPPEAADLPPALTIHAADPAIHAVITAVDHAAFGPLWRMSPADLRAAMRSAASCTVGVVNGQIVGYQLSTMYFDGSHLARLAVLPSAQAHGVGAALVGDVLRRFQRRGVTAMTVNTQLSNVRSQRLYTRLGFVRTGYDLPVWRCEP
ncbi:MAG: GNAT family N-acetyltransferase [bacterium]|nr:GNAT family N-acetyltransferase [bacterium]